MVKKRLGETVPRRLREERLPWAGKRPAEAAHAVGVARHTAYTRKALLDEGGIEALRAMPSRGHPARLDEQPLHALGRMLDIFAAATEDCLRRAGLDALAAQEMMPAR